MDLTYVLYDTAPFINAAGEFILFQVPRGGDSTHTEGYTNMRGAGSLPENEKFVCNWVGFGVDSLPVIADIPKIHRASFLEILLSDRTIFKVPLQLLITNSTYRGEYTQATAADLAYIALDGKGFDLTIPITFNGGDNFKVRVYQGTALSGTFNMKVYLKGTLTISG